MDRLKITDRFCVLDWFLDEFSQHKAAKILAAQVSGQPTSHGSALGL